MTDWGQYTEAFLLGNGAILTNVCVLPLYPGMIAFMAGTSAGGHRRGQFLLGLFVLFGILGVMIGLGLILYLLNRSFSSILDWFLPLIYLIVALLGVLMLAERNPFARMTISFDPLHRNPFASAFSYGVLLGPMTLPCAGPVVISAFVIGAGSASSLAEGLIYFVAFGFGFGWPLAALPVLTSAVQRRLTGWLAAHHSAVNRLSGVTLIVIALFGFWTEIRPNLVD